MNGLGPGDRLGDWVVERALGEGGMGSVYRCHSALSDEVRAAVKVLTDATSAELRQRFVQELRTLHGLSHPGIVRVLGGGIDEARGLLFIAMELVDGESLEDVLGRGPMASQGAIACFATIADALAHSHETGVFHRDIKPANLMLRRSGGAVLVDFGIAVSRDRTRVTREGMLPGTLAYLPPEAFQGELPDPRATDAYAFGVTFFEALTGANAFPLSEHGSDGQRLAQITGQKMRAEALDPGDAFPESAREVIRRTTDPEPETRLRDLGEVVGLLAPGASRAAGATNQTWGLPLDPPKPAKKRRRGWMIALAVLTVGGVGAVAVAAVLVVAVVAGGVAWTASRGSGSTPVRPRVDLAESLRAGAAALEAGDRTEAYRHAGLALDAHPEDPNANLLYGQVLAARGEADLARPYLCAAIRAGVEGDLGFDRGSVPCDPGPAAATPLTASLTLARVDLRDALAPTDAVAVVEGSDAEAEAARAPTSRRARSATASRPAPSGAASPGGGAAISEKSAMSEPREELADEVVIAEPAPEPAAAKRSARPVGKPAPAAEPLPPLTEARVLATLDADREIGTCRAAAAAAGVPKDAMITFRLKIDATGRVRSLEVVRSSTGHPETDACFRARLRYLRFPTSGSGAELTVAVRAV